MGWPLWSMTGPGISHAASIGKGKYMATELLGEGAEHYGKQGLCRVQLSLLSAKSRALDKELFCRVPHSATIYTRQRRLCRSAKPDTRQMPFLPSVRHSANSGAQQKMASGNGRRLPSRFAERQTLTLDKGLGLPVCRVPDRGTRQRCFPFFLKSKP